MKSLQNVWEKKEQLTKCQLFLWFYPLLSHLCDFSGENNLCLGRTIDTVGLDTDNDTTTSLQEKMGIQSDNSGLIRLSNIGEDYIDHPDQHPVSKRMSSIFNNWDDVGTVSGHSNKITARSVGEFNSINSSSGSNDISNMTD